MYIYICYKQGYMQKQGKVMKLVMCHNFDLFMYLDFKLVLYDVFVCVYFNIFVK